MARPKKAERQELLSNTRGKLLHAAAAEFAREGYVGANINRISLAAGFSKGTIYNYFPSKRDLMLGLIDSVASTHITAILEGIEPELSATDKLTQFFRAGFAYVESQPAEARSVIHAVYGPDSGFQEQVYQSYEPLFAVLLKEILGAGVASGEFRPLDLDLATALTMTVYLGSCSQMDAEGKIWLEPEKAAGFILDGIRPRAADGS